MALHQRVLRSQLPTGVVLSQLDDEANNPISSENSFPALDEIMHLLSFINGVKYYANMFSHIH